MFGSRRAQLHPELAEEVKTTKSRRISEDEVKEEEKKEKKKKKGKQDELLHLW